MHSLLQNMNFGRKKREALLINFIIFHNSVGQECWKTPLCNSSAAWPLSEATQCQLASMYACLESWRWSHSVTGTLLAMARRLGSAGSAYVLSHQIAAQGSQVSHLTAKGSKRASQKLQGFFWLSLGSITYTAFYWSRKSEAQPMSKEETRRLWAAGGMAHWGANFGD